MEKTIYDTVTATNIAEGVLIEIRDQGSGIPDWALAKITNPFFSLPRPETKQRSSGLGLTIAKETIEAHNGQLEFENLVEGAGGVGVSGLRVRVRI